jgi:hypothetical protein
MKSSLMIALISFSLSIPLAAQASFGVVGQLSPSTTQTTVQTFHVTPICPAVLKAEHLADGSMIRAGTRADHSHPSGIGQWLHITLAAQTASTATIAVHGFSNRARMTEAGGAGGADAIRTVTVSFAPSPDGQAAGDVWAPGLTAVQSIELISVTYKDGSAWNPVNGQTCRVAADPLMLVSGR